jgi:hypothetical protein
MALIKRPDYSCGALSPDAHRPERLAKQRLGHGPSGKGDLMRLRQSAICGRPARWRGAAHGSVAVAARPDENEAVVLGFDQRSEDRSQEARVIELDREVFAAGARHPLPSGAKFIPPAVKDPEVGGVVVTLFGIARLDRLARLKTVYAQFHLDAMERSLDPPEQTYIRSTFPRDWSPAGPWNADRSHL